MMYRATIHADKCLLDFISIDLKQLVAPSMAADRKMEMDAYNAAR